MQNVTTHVQVIWLVCRPVNSKTNVFKDYTASDT